MLPASAAPLVRRFAADAFFDDIQLANAAHRFSC
jgi:hypothetical protein